MKLPSNRPEDLLPEYKDAYDALPECYRADSCLQFIEMDNLYAVFDLGGTYIWDEKRLEWLECLSGRVFEDSPLKDTIYDR